MFSQAEQPRFIVIRRGPVFYEWRYREQLPSKFKTTKIPSSLAPKDALDIVCHDWLELHPNEVITGAWELTEEEIVAGKKGVREEDVVRNLKILSTVEV